MTPVLAETPSFASATPLLSVLIPFLRDDPSALIAQLATEADAVGGTVEVILLDDGTADANLSQRLTAQLGSTRLPMRLITLAQNEGRSIGRNRLAKQARAPHLLFLDSDMKPDRHDFLKAWLALLQQGRCAIAFGGFSLKQAPQDPRFAVHRSMAAKSDCLDASQRELHPEKYVFTSNLMISRDILESDGFDPAFSGWGWEDVEWAMRVSRQHKVCHVDIPATHMGLDTVEALMSKYEQSVSNFARVLAKHPDYVTSYPSYRVARILSRLPGRSILRVILRTLIRASRLPVKLRSFSLRLYRAALYAEVV